ncbi:hypothetical protein JXA85_05195 [Candidatus Woesearchaeota archaeon]|nr:hypothetical protein [Candidatus Woesearchaeota archaeon]
MINILYAQENDLFFRGWSINPDTIIKLFGLLVLSLLAFSSANAAFEIIYTPSNTTNLQEFPVIVLAQNNDKGNNNYSMHSYLFRGSKCYSGMREANMVNFSIDGKSYRIIRQTIIPDIAEQGGYKVMVKVKNTESKSWNSLSKEIDVTIPKQAVCEERPVEINNCTGFANEKTVYESSSLKAAKLVPLFFMLACSVFCIGILFWKTE